MRQLIDVAETPSTPTRENMLLILESTVLDT